MGWKILLPQEIMAEGRKLLEDAGHELIMGRGFETQDVLEDMKKYQPDAMIVRITPITREVIEANPNLKVIVRHGAGFDTVDLKACEDNNVQTLYAPVANSTSVAETALLLMFETSRNVTVLHKTWVTDFYKAKLKVRKNTLSGKTLGLVGCGNIGSRVAVRALALEMNVLAYDPYKPAKDFPDGVEVVRDLNRIFTECDYVSLHAPSTPVTKNMINKETLAMMKPTAILINTARGALVVEEDLYGWIRRTRCSLWTTSSSIRTSAATLPRLRTERPTSPLWAFRKSTKARSRPGRSTTSTTPPRRPTTT